MAAAPTSFPQFPKLPLELRIRVFEIFFDQFEMILSGKHWERLSGKKILSNLSLPDNNTTTIAPEADMALYSRYAFLVPVHSGPSSVKLGPIAENRSILQGIRHLLFVDGVASYGLGTPYEDLPDLFPALESITLDVGRLIGKTPSWICCVRTMLEAFDYVPTLRVVKWWGDIDLALAVSRIDATHRLVSGCERDLRE